MRSSLAMLALLGSGPTAADDPWSRPTHLRAVAAPPVTWSDLSSPRSSVRLWWDETPASATVQVLRRDRWRTLSRAATPGWTSPPVPRGTAFRVRLEDGARWSDPTAAPPWVTPAELARLVSPGPALLATAVGQVEPAGDVAWASTLGGGLARLGAGDVEVWTRWEGLPDARALAVSVAGEEVLVGTTNGAALLRDGRVVTVWDDALPPPHVQAVLLHGPERWLGTYLGLSCDTIDAPPAGIAGSPSVFSLTADGAGTIWAGVDGLLRLSPGAAPCQPSATPVPELLGQHVYGAAPHGQILHAAVLGSGVWRLTDSARPERQLAIPEATDVTTFGEARWIAAGSDGLRALDGRRWGRAEGLPDATIWTVAAARDGLWLGTARGAARLHLTPDGALAGVSRAPLSPLPAGVPALTVLPTDDGAWVAGPDGLRVIGQPHPSAGDLVVAAQSRVVAVLEDTGATWAISDRALRLDRAGHLQQLELPAQVTDAALWGGRLWVSGPQGLWSAALPDGGAGFRRETALTDVTRLAAGPDALWAIAGGVIARLTDRGARTFVRTGVPLDLAPDAHGVWVGTQSGLERLLPDGEVESIPGTTGITIPAVSAGDAGGCWFAAADGTIGHVGDAAGRVLARLPGPFPARPLRLAADGERAWLATDEGVWVVRAP